VTASPVKSVAAHIPRRAWIGLGISGAGQVLWAFNLTATNIAFDEIGRDFPDAGDAVIGWVAAVFFIGSASLLLIAGRLADRIGRKKIFEIGLGIFALSAVGSFLAPNVWWLIGARALGSAGAACVIPAGLSVILPEFPREKHGTAVGIWAASGPVAATISPSASALILGVASWRTLYLISAPIALIAALAGGWVLTESKAEGEPGPLDIVGAALGTMAIAVLVFVTLQGADLGWTNPLVAGAVIVAVASGYLFVKRSRAHPEPLLDLDVFLLPPVRISNIANFLTSTVGTSAWLVWPVFMDRVWGFEKWQIGLALTPGPIVAGTSTILAGRLVDRIGWRPVLLIGSIVAPLSTLIAILTVSTSERYWIALFPPIALFGMGWAFVIPPLNSGVLRRVSADLFGQVNASFTTVRNVAGAIGIAVVVAMLARVDDTNPIFTYRLIFIIFFASQVASLVVIGLFYTDDDDPG